MKIPRQLKPKPVTVKDHHYADTDEIYEAFFNCPRCKGGSIIQSDNYCSCCGVKLNWDLNDDYS